MAGIGAGRISRDSASFLLAMEIRIAPDFDRSVLETIESRRQSG